MICAWNELLDILPHWLRPAADDYGYKSIQEIRLRSGMPPELRTNHGSIWLKKKITKDDLSFVVNTASQYSPWNAVTSSEGYITAPGGHRIGLCGDAVIRSGRMEGFRHIQSLCIRVAKDYSGIASCINADAGSILILGAPGWGKTTLLRDLSRKIAAKHYVGVVDERGELFPDHFARGEKMDVIRGCPKPIAVETVLRTMGPECITVDEITASKDCAALIQAHGCGVQLIAAAHAASADDFHRREVYRPLNEQKIFERLIVMNADKSFYMMEAA